MVDKRCRWPSGKMLGGSSGLNYMLHVRGHPADYDAWAEETGDTSWSYQEIRKYFDKAEKHVTEKGSGGLLPVSDPSHVSSLSDDILSMARDSGYKVEDVNNDTEDNNKTLFTLPKVNQEQGRRAGTYHSYLRGALHRPNLRVMRNSRALRIMTSRHGRAVGVQYSRYGTEATVRCSREVIVSAGTVNSAKLLMLSGVGPREELDRLGIKVVADLPVGQNLQVT